MRSIPRCVQRAVIFLWAPNLGPAGDKSTELDAQKIVIYGKVRLVGDGSPSERHGAGRSGPAFNFGGTTKFH